MTKFYQQLLLITIALVLIGISISLYFRLPILTGYAAKMACSCHFVSQRNLESIINEDLNFSPASYASVSIDDKKQIATATVFGLAKQIAQYRTGLGCTLIPKNSKLANFSNPNFIPVPPVIDSNFNWFTGRDSIINKIDTALIEAVFKAAFIPEAKSRSLLVVYKGKIIKEQYAKGFDANTPQLGWSMTKSITSALIGVLVKQGKLERSAPIPISEWQTTDRKMITLNNLLQMNSGLSWKEDYANISDATKMLYIQSSGYNYAVSKNLKYPVGTTWEYSSGTSNILAGIVKQKFVDENEYLNFPRTALFNKIGMTSALIETDVDQTFFGSSYCFATSRDWAKFGLLYLYNGVWNGEQILPKNWVAFTQTPAIGSKNRYGGHFWLNKDKHLPDIPESVYSCDGFQGQRVFIVPTHDLVVVRTGLSPEGSFDFNALLRTIIQALSEPTNK